MIKKKLTAMIAVLLVCVMLFPTAAFAYASDGESTPAETQTAPRMYRKPTMPPNRQMSLNPAKTMHFPLIPMS